MDRAANREAVRAQALATLQQKSSNPSNTNQGPMPAARGPMPHVVSTTLPVKAPPQKLPPVSNDPEAFLPKEVKQAIAANQEKAGTTTIEGGPEFSAPAAIKTELANHESVEHERIELPSNFIFYDWTDIQIRAFKVRELATLARAIKANNISLQIDVIGNTINRPVRELTIPDLRFVMYWLKLNSYLKTPFEIEWTSKYGNENRHIITSSNMKIKMLDMTREQYEPWRQRGFQPARVRDMEIFETEKLDEETRWLYERAQYLIGDSVAERIQRLEDMGVGGMEDIATFSNDNLSYGVDESFTGRDIHFKADVWLKGLKDSLAEMQRRLEIIDEPGPKISMRMDMQDLELEIANLEKKLANGEVVVADEETRDISISFGDFFSGI